jgi:hypothetical protein
MVWFRGFRKSGSFAVGCVLGLGVRLRNSPAQLKNWNNGMLELWNDGFKENETQSTYSALIFTL